MKLVSVRLIRLNKLWAWLDMCKVKVPLVLLSREARIIMREIGRIWKRFRTSFVHQARWSRSEDEIQFDIGWSNVNHPGIGGPGRDFFDVVKKSQAGGGAEFEERQSAKLNRDPNYWISGQHIFSIYLAKAISGSSLLDVRSLFCLVFLLIFQIERAMKKFLQHLKHRKNNSRISSKEQNRRSAEDRRHIIPNRAKSNHFRRRVSAEAAAGVRRAWSSAWAGARPVLELGNSPGQTMGRL